VSDEGRQRDHQYGEERVSDGTPSHFWYLAPSFSGSSD
jgi:hypothetical protein